jgi:hypothetical protein
MQYEWLELYPNALFDEKGANIVFATHVDGSCVSTVYVYVYVYGGAVTHETPCVLYSGVFNLNDLRI